MTPHLPLVSIFWQMVHELAHVGERRERHHRAQNRRPSGKTGCRPRIKSEGRLFADQALDQASSRTAAHEGRTRRPVLCSALRMVVHLARGVVAAAVAGLESERRYE